MRLIVGGDKLGYAFELGYPATNLVEKKMLLNSVISDANKGAKFVTMDLKDRFLHTQMEHPEYMKLPYKYFPKEIRIKYNLSSLLTSDGYIYIKIIKGMYGLKQSALLAHIQLSTLLVHGGYISIEGSQNMWKHFTRKTLFCLCVDDFGVKVYSKEDLEHFQNTVQKTYTCKTDFSGKTFLGFTIYWKYEKGYVDISMPGYVKRALETLMYEVTVYPQYSPYECIPINYTSQSKRQYAMQEEKNPLLLPKQTTYIQRVVGTFLYYALGINLTMLPAINQISMHQ